MAGDRKAEMGERAANTAACQKKQEKEEPVGKHAKRRKIAHLGEEKKRKWGRKSGDQDQSIQ